MNIQASKLQAPEKDQIPSTNQTEGRYQEVGLGAWFTCHLRDGPVQMTEMIGRRAPC